MSLTRDEAIKRAKADLAKRLGVGEDEIAEESVEDADFPDMALGAGVADEMSGQMITSGWRIRLRGKEGAGHEYRASRDQLRLYNYKGANYRI